MDKQNFIENFRAFLGILQGNICQNNTEWKVKGFIDSEKNIFSLSNDTKVISKILEIHIFPYILEFANANAFDIVLPNHQNYYPDLSFVLKQDSKIKFAVDLKTTYRNENNPTLCNGFTLGSHGEYFRNRESNKNIQFPYKDYLGHFCLGIIYDRVLVNELRQYTLNDLDKIQSVITNLTLFFAEKYKIASDVSGSGNTANIGSIKNIDAIINEKGIFAELGEEIFNDYWINYGQINITDSHGNIKKITKLEEYLKYRGKK
ncbi:type II restriction endonuclease [Helicobacter sp. MIT 05-5294]|uniref:type II restriction endonuclease n=1 Tax=Helicobacter sp. MIT 05-5294 TaxID=1548150 RepID=UPI00051FA00C|nr:type II restriction endonuclease [Helicobacter sp. MIT 05-5294]TLD87234.1 restriction endonuclease [Helicobacter sp. MIT 05-5294]